MLKEGWNLYFSKFELEFNGRHKAKTLGSSANVGEGEKEESSSTSGIWSNFAADYEEANKFAEIMLSNWIGHQSVDQSRLFFTYL